MEVKIWQEDPRKKQETRYIPIPLALMTLERIQPLTIFLYTIIPQETGKIIRLFSGQLRATVQGGSELLQRLIPPFIDRGTLDAQFFTDHIDAVLPGVDKEHFKNQIFIIRQCGK